MRQTFCLAGTIAFSHDCNMQMRLMSALSPSLILSVLKTPLDSGKPQNRLNNLNLDCPSLILPIRLSESIWLSVWLSVSLSLCMTRNWFSTVFYHFQSRSYPVSILSILVDLYSPGWYGSGRTNNWHCAQTVPLTVWLSDKISVSLSTC